MTLLKTTSSFVFTAMLLIGCTDSEQQANNQPQFPTFPPPTVVPPTGPGNNPSNNPQNQEPVAECNTFQFNNSGSSGQVQTYYTSSSTYDSSRIKLRFLSVDYQFTDYDDVYFDFFRWKNNSTSTYIDPRALSFDVVERRSNRQIGSFTTQKMNGSQLLSLANRYGTSTQITDYDFIIKGTTIDYQVIRIAMKRPNGSGTDVVIDETDFLIPAFTANPAIYASTKSTILAGIHPFYNRQGSWTSMDYKGMIEGEGCWN